MSNYFHGFMRFQILRITLVHLILLIILTSCDKIPGEEEGLENEPKKYGVVLTVDDGYIDQWYEYLDYMSEMNVLLTFYLTRYHTYSNETKRKVKELISRGHEMAFHGTNHYCY